MAEGLHKQALLAELQTSRAEWDALVTQLLQREMAETPLTGKWTLKDVSAHLMFWENRCVKWLEAAQRGMEPEPSPLPKELSEDDENEWIYQQYRVRPLQEIIAESRRVHEAVVDAVRAIADQELETKRAWLRESSLADALPGNSYEHFRDHVKMIREWLAQQPS